MTAPPMILSACALVSAGLAIWADAKGRRRIFRLAKPLTTVTPFRLKPKEIRSAAN